MDLDAPDQSAAAAAPPQSHADHPADSSAAIIPEQAAVYSVAVIGLLSNLLLISLVLGQRHTRRLTSAFVVHSAFLNLILSGLALAFGRGLSSEGISSSSCRSLITGYMVFHTIWVFNVIPTVCCEIYYLDSGLGRPSGSVGCAVFGVCLVYICSAILHLGPTLIGSNFQWKGQDDRCLFLHGHPKNYTAYLMWIVIVTVALAAASYMLVVFRRSIDRSMRARLSQAGGGLVKSSAADVAIADLVNSDAALANRLGDLANIKANRQRVLWAVCGLCVVCWYPLFLLVLSDPHYHAPESLYHLFTVLGFSRTILEPLTVAVCDRRVGRLNLRLLPCTRRLRYVSETEIDDRLAAAAAANCPERSDSTSAIASGSSTAGRRQQQLPTPQPPPPTGHTSLARPLITSSRDQQQQSPPMSDVFSPSPLSFD